MNSASHFVPIILQLQLYELPPVQRCLFHLSTKQSQYLLLLSLLEL